MKKNIKILFSLFCLFSFAACSSHVEEVIVTFYIESEIYEIQELNKGDFASKPNDPPNKIAGSCSSTFAFWIYEDSDEFFIFNFKVHKIEKNTTLTGAYHDDCSIIE